MQKPKKKNRLGLLSLTAVGVMALALVPANVKGYAEEGVQSPQGASVFEESYASGETVQLPERTVSDGNKEYTAHALVTTPSGITLTGSSVLLDEAGKYSVSYVANKEDGTVIKEEYSFIVADQLYSVTSSLSTLGYGHSLANYDINSDVVLASVSSRDRFNFTPKINLNQLDGKEFLEFFVTPEVIGTPDASKIQVMLTDAYDEDNFVVISIKKGTAAEAGAAWAEVNSYLTANAVGQVPAGLETGYTGIVVNGEDYRLQKGTVWGANIRFALPGNPGYVSVTTPNNEPSMVASQSLKLSLDNQTGEIYANGQLVTVLKNSDIYDDVLWKGFTTGECYLSVYGESFNAGTLGLGIKSLGGVSFTDGEVENKFFDGNAPEITIDYGGETEAPSAITGKPYRLFNAIATDDYSGNCSVKASVYYVYGERQIRVGVRDNCFVPEKAGEYLIKYSATDRNGNTAERTVTVTAVPDDTPTLSVTVADAADGVAGVMYGIAVPSFENRTGKVHWSAVAALDGDSGISYEISSEDPNFIPEYAGSYTLTYTYGDYITTGTVNKKFTVSASQKPVITGAPVLPKYVMLGCEYQLPAWEGTVYADGTPVVKPCEIYVSEDGGSERKINNGKLVTYARREIRITYRITDGDGAETASVTIPVIDVGYNGNYKIEKYFYGDGFTPVTNKDYIRFTADKAEGTAAQMTFINQLQTFDFQLRAYASGNGFNKLNVYLTDSNNEGVRLKFSYRSENGLVRFSINDGEEVTLAGASFNQATAALFLAFNGRTNTVMPTGISALSYQVTHDLSGEPFNGFENMSAYMTVELDGITNKNNASVNIVNLNGQKISNVYTDITKPQLSATTASGDRVQGTEYVISKVYAADVLDVVKGTMTVTAPDGSYAVTKDGVELKPGSDISRDYVIVLEQFGAYTVKYEVTDICGNKLTYEYVLRAADFTPPDIKINSPVTEGTVGAAIKVAGITVTDNKDEAAEDFTVFITVTTPDFRSHSLTDANGNSAAHFTVAYAGEYTVTYMVIDSSGNTATASYKVNVK